MVAKEPKSFRNHSTNRALPYSDERNHNGDEERRG